MKKVGVLNSYAVVGSTVIASIKNDRNAVGIEKEKEYRDISKQRINDFKEGKLKIKSINKPIHKPSGNDKVSQVSKKWLQLELENVKGKVWVNEISFFNTPFISTFLGSCKRYCACSVVNIFLSIKC